MRTPFAIWRRLTWWLVAAQLLNLSLCGDVYQDAARYDSAVDPTESLVEWFAEMHFGQLAAFDYPHTMDTHKGPAKSMHWHVAKWHYAINTEHYPSFTFDLRLVHTLLLQRVADRSLDRPPRT